MSQIDTIVESLRVLFNGTAALSVTLPGGLLHGARVDADTIKPFGTLVVEENIRQYSSARVALVDYFVILKVYVVEQVGRAGEILRIFHRYFDRIQSLPSLDADLARLVLVFPGKSEVTEDESEEFGSDIIVGTTRWLMRIQEHEPALS